MARRRGNREGSIYQRASDGRWMGAVSAGDGSAGRSGRKTVSAPTRTGSPPQTAGAPAPARRRAASARCLHDRGTAARPLARRRDPAPGGTDRLGQLQERCRPPHRACARTGEAQGAHSRRHRSSDGPEARGRLVRVHGPPNPFRAEPGPHSGHSVGERQPQRRQPHTRPSPASAGGPDVDTVPGENAPGVAARPPERSAVLPHAVDRSPTR